MKEPLVITPLVVRPLDVTPLNVRPLVLRSLDEILLFVKPQVVSQEHLT